MPRLLVIDDTATIRQLMRSYIEQADYIVCGEAQDGLQGIEIAKQTQPDLILQDSAERASFASRMLLRDPPCL